MTGEDVHALAGAYALGALHDDEERQAFQDHLSRCEACATEVGELLATSAVLGRAAAVPAPPSLRARVLSRIQDVPQDPAPMSPAPAVPSGSVVPLADRRSARRRWGPVAAVVLAAACLVVAIVAGSAAVRDQRRLDDARDGNRALAAVLAAPDARTATGGLSTGGTMTVVAAPSRHRAVVASAGLRAPGRARTYELWTMGRAGVRPAGLLRPDTAGRVAPRLASLPAGTDRVALTIEPAGGSPQPTTTPLVVLTL